MKPCFLLLLCALCSFSSLSAQSNDNPNYVDKGFVVFTQDLDGQRTNIRATPGGKVVCSLPVDSVYTFILEESVTENNGWIRIPDDGLFWYDKCADDHDEDEDVDYTLDGHRVMLSGSTTGYWIHNSVLRLMVFSDGALKIKPDDGADVVYQSSDFFEVHPLRCEEGWVKVKTLDGKYTGWLSEAEVVRHELLYNTDCSCGEEDFGPMGPNLYRDHFVNGGPGIRQFIKALRLEHPDYGWPTEPVFDATNGYFSYAEEGTGHVNYNAAIWNRADGKKLFVFSYSKGDEHYVPEGEDPNEYVKSFEDMKDSWYWLHSYVFNNAAFYEDNGYIAFLYEPNKRMIIPVEENVFNGMPDSKLMRYVETPRYGKDIQVREYDPSGKESHTVYHTLKWNGMTFDYVK